MKMYNYFYSGQPIPKQQFLKAVPENWKTEIKDGEFSWGYYQAIEIIVGDLEAYALKNGSKGIKTIPHIRDEKVLVRVTVSGHKRLNGWYMRSYLKSLNLIK